MRKARGATLIELAIVSTLLIIITGMVYQVVQAGVAFYLDSNSAMEIRQDALVGLNRLSVELRQSSMASVHAYMTPAPGDPPGIVFASPRDENGAMTATSDGKITWRRFVCCYLGDYQDYKALLRKTEVIATPPERAPDPEEQSPRRDTHYFFVNLAATKPTLIARHVTALTITPTTDSVEIDLTCEISSRHRHSIQLKTRVIPNLL